MAAAAFVTQMLLFSVSRHDNTIVAPHCARAKNDDPTTERSNSIVAYVVVRRHGKTLTIISLWRTLLGIMTFPRQIERSK